jgi:peroxiredoxin
MKQFILLIAVATLAGCFGAEPQKTGKEGKPMPEFSMLTMDSTLLLSRDIPTGKSIAMFYFSPFCPYCKAQTETIVENIDKLKDIQFYFISTFPLSTVREFYKSHQLAKYPNITVAVDSAHAFADFYEVTGVPYTAVYAKNKTLNKSFMGKIYSSEIKKAAEE